MVLENSTGTSRPSHAWIRLALGSLAFVTLAAGLSFYKLRNGTAPARRTRAQLEKLGDRGTSANAAWESYWNGRSFLQAAGGPDQSDNAIQAFELAVKADPLYAL